MIFFSFDLPNEVMVFRVTPSPAVLQGMTFIMPCRHRLLYLKYIKADSRLLSLQLNHFLPQLYHLLMTTLPKMPEQGIWK